MGRTNDTLEHKKTQLAQSHDLGHQQISQHMSNSTTFEGWSEEEVARYKGKSMISALFEGSLLMV